ncbi:DUF1440 domain-containing protein [Pseudoflavitalea sp. G-6-1-2]|uniref:DUF1440 domain-containing protein n=1 Tax=Pseudoflavitalea sp. G-6-1-2 TaxID=2728841 RepID=UPI00146B2B67|nr:DUF1440 domain-containing protein [Pseudoflavitalea sp. G-6-1-2]NML23134.1 DUF1440 domain-containing protein [Pseudoflavitalea sp. G-6-1-2]
MSTITNTAPVQTSGRGLLKAILWATLIAGTLDIISAIVISGAVSGTFAPIRLLQGIAYGAVGKSAFEGGLGMALVGLLFHYCFALIFATVFFLLYPVLPILQRNAVLWGMVYGVVAWSIMNGLVIPLSHIGPVPFLWWKALVNIVILMYAIGIPIALIARKYYSRKRLNTVEG